jgi:hypothetical protein
MVLELWRAGVTVNKATASTKLAGGLFCTTQQAKMTLMPAKRLTLASHGPVWESCTHLAQQYYQHIYLSRYSMTWQAKCLPLGNGCTLHTHQHQQVDHKCCSSTTHHKQCPVHTLCSFFALPSLLEAADAAQTQYAEHPLPRPGRDCLSDLIALAWAAVRC